MTPVKGPMASCPAPRGDQPLPEVPGSSEHFRKTRDRVWHVQRGGTGMWRVSQSNLITLGPAKEGCGHKGM